MRVFIFEYLTGGGLLSQNASPSMLAEGEVMAQALIRDLLAIPGIGVILLRDHRAAVCHALSDPRVEEIRVSSEPQFRSAWRAALDRCDAVWVIAPETDGILEGLCREAETSGTPSLACPAPAVQLLADKEQTVRRLAAYGIRTVPTSPASAVRDLHPFPVVVKPVDGAGCSGSRILRSADEWSRWARHEDLQRQIVQPLLVGEALSLSVLFDHARSTLISCNRQHVRVADHRFVLDACTVNILTQRRPEFEGLAQRIAEAVPELWGYAGIDLIDREQGAAVLEINPRLTTSYAGLHQALGVNPAQWVCDLWRNGTLPDRVPMGTGSVRINVGPQHEH